MMQLIMMLYSISWYQVSSTEQNIIFYARNKQFRSLICFQIKKRKKKTKICNLKATENILSARWNQNFVYFCSQIQVLIKN